MGAPFVIRSDDAGAPILGSSEGGLLTVLDYCLVTVAGWTKEFSDATKAVYRPASGLRYFYQVDDSTAATYLTCGAPITCYQSMSSVSSGTNMLGVGHIKHHYTVPWVAIVDSAGFWFCYLEQGLSLSITNNATNGQFSYFGDIIPLPNRNPASVLSIIEGDNSACFSSCTYTSTSNTVSKGLVLSANNAGTLNVPCALYPGPGQYGPMGGPNYPEYTSELLYTRPVLNDGAAYTVRGYLPGLYSPLHKSLGHMVTYSDSGRTLLSMKGISGAWSTSNYCHIFIDIGTGFRP